MNMTRAAMGFLGAVLVMSLAGCDGSGVWTDQSVTIDVKISGFPDVNFGFHRKRADLTAEQLAILKGLETIPTKDTCLQDGTWAFTSVTDEDGLVREYVSNDNGSDCMEGWQMIPLSSITELLDTVTCFNDWRVSAQDTSAAAEPTAITAGNGCLHGLAVADVDHWRFHVDVPEPGTYTVAVSDCGERVLQLSVTDAATAQVTTSDAVPCASLDVNITSGAGAILQVDDLSGSEWGYQFFSVERRDAE